MKIPKNHKQYREQVYLTFDYGLTRDEAVAEIDKAFDQAEKDGVIDAHLFGESGYYNHGDDGYFEWHIMGYVPMTEAELERAKLQRKVAREANKRRKEEQEKYEIEQLKLLAKKHGVELPEVL